MMKSLLVRQVLKGWRRPARVRPIAMFGIVMVSVSLIASVVKADVLHDTSGMITNQTANTAESAFIGGLGAFSELRDNQVADDFVLSNTFNITSVTGAFFLQEPMGGGLPTGGLLVEFFADNGFGSPQESPAAAVLTQNFTGTPFDLFGLSDLYYLTADLSGEDIQLDSGTWWLSVTPVDESATGGHWKQFRQTGFVEGSGAHYRAGGDDHGNGYPGIIYADEDWTLFGGQFGGAGDLAMMVEGALIPAPSALVMLGLGGLLGKRRKRRG